MSLGSAAAADADAFLAPPPARPMIASYENGDRVTLRTYFVETWGCQMNQLDSARLSGRLLQAGWQTAPTLEEADLVLLNTCSIRDKAEQKVYSQLGRYRHLKKARPGLQLGVCGCVAQQQGEGIHATVRLQYMSLAAACPTREMRWAFSGFSCWSTTSAPGGARRSHG